MTRTPSIASSDSSMWSRDALLRTKLYTPEVRPGRVPRPRLTARLDEGLTRRLTLVSAPAGFGKTTLVSEWLQQADRPITWLSLEVGDNDPAHFLAYLAAALQKIDDGWGQAIQTVLQSPQPPPSATLLTALINEITTAEASFVLVLDDYHLISAPPIHEMLAFLLDHMPPHMHLVILTRADPSLPLARLRARNQLTEIRADDLRFTAEESAAFLNQVMGLDLSPEQIAALEIRTEGWVAGLQLAALSLQGLRRDGDVASFIETFAGSHRYVMDYLIEEVFNRQPPDIQEFLLQTSILMIATYNLAWLYEIQGQRGVRPRFVGRCCSPLRNTPGRSRGPRRVWAWSTWVWRTCCTKGTNWRRQKSTCRKGLPWVNWGTMWVP